MLAQESRLVSDHTIQAKRVALKRASEWAMKNNAPSDPKKWIGSDVKAYWKSIDHLTESSQLQYLTQLLMFLRWCGNPNLADVKLRITPSRVNVDWLTEEQVALAISMATNPAVRAMIILMSTLGLRREEACRIHVSDMHADWVQVRGKGFKARKIPISKEVWVMLGFYTTWRNSIRIRAEDQDIFILNKFKRRYSLESIEKLFSKLSRRVGFHFSPHTFRRTYGRLMFFMGCPLVRLQRFLGHQSINQTIQYLGIEYMDVTDGAQYIPRYGGGLI